MDHSLIFSDLKSERHFLLAIQFLIGHYEFLPASNVGNVST